MPKIKDEEEDDFDDDDEDEDDEEEEVKKETKKDAWDEEEDKKPKKEVKKSDATTYEKVEVTTQTAIAIRESGSEKVLSMEDCLVKILNDLSDLKKTLM